MIFLHAAGRYQQVWSDLRCAMPPGITLILQASQAGVTTGVPDCRLLSTLVGPRQVRILPSAPENAQVSVGRCRWRPVRCGSPCSHSCSQIAKADWEGGNLSRGNRRERPLPSTWAVRQRPESHTATSLRISAQHARRGRQRTFRGLYEPRAASTGLLERYRGRAPGAGKRCRALPAPERGPSRGARWSSCCGHVEPSLAGVSAAT